MVKNRVIFFWLMIVVLVIVFFLVAALPELDLLAGTSIGRVDIEGAIYSSEDILDQLETMRRDDNIGAVILRVNSPGGGVGPSQEIYREVKRLRDEGKLVVVSMGAVAASGGYYVSAPANWIFSNPGTITGSVGVIAEYTNVDELMGKIGVKVLPIKSGRLKDTGSPFRDMDDGERVFLQGMVDEVYRQFLDDVIRERQLTEETVDLIKDGRVITGSQAVQMGLVDEIGNFRDAINYTAEQLGIPSPYRLVEKKPRRGLLDLIQGSAKEILPASIPGWGLRLSYLYVT